MTTVPPESARLAALEESGWGRSLRLVRPRNLAFWVYALFVVSGGATLATSQVDIADVYTTALVSGTVWFAIYAIAFWWFIRHLDRYTPQPTGMAVAAFVWGGLAATWAMAADANNAVRSILGKVFGQGFTLDWGAAIAAPFDEEFAKAAGLVLLIAIAPRLVRSAFDGLVLGAFLGLGFQVFEDVAYVWQHAAAQFGADQGQAAAGIIVTRSIFGVTAHYLYSAIFCAGLVYVLGRPQEPARRTLGLTWILIALAGHAAWDAESAIGGGRLALVYGLLIPGTMLVMAVVFVWVYRTTVPRERAWMRDVMAPEVARGVITNDELVALSGTRKQRKAYVKAGKGRRARAAAKHVLEAAQDLAGEIATARGADTSEVQFARGEVNRLRAESLANAAAGGT